MNVLIISAEVWKEDSNGGNILSNIFEGSNFNFAQIYCNPGAPKNSLCNKYYQMTDSMVIRNILKKGEVGKVFCLGDKNSNISKPEEPKKKFYEFFHNHRWSVFYAAKEIAWNLCDWKNDRLKFFLDEFQPDVIFAPCYGSKFMLAFTRFVADYTGKNVISYISDDHYTLHQLSFSPYFWVNRLILRRELKKTFPYYSLVYTMTEEQKVQCERNLGGNMKILRKSVSFAEVVPQTEIRKPIRIVYAGGIYLNRWKTLKILADAIHKINKEDGNCYRLDIYTANEITKKIDRALNNSKDCFLHPSVSQEELARIYRDSHIALHVESFDIKNRLLVRMSFSTKIVDCLSSGCAVMAICDKKQGGYQYLEKEDAAFCVSSKDEIFDLLNNLINNPGQITKYALKAKQCCDRNHTVEPIRKMIHDDFERIVRD